MIDDLFTFLVQERGYEDLDDFLASHPSISKPEKHMLLGVKCSQCSYESSEEYPRQNPDKLRLMRWCPDCHADLVLIDAIPRTIFHWSRKWKHATFSDNTDGECWHCGRKKGPLHAYTFSNGQGVELCRKDFTRYHKDIWRVNERRAQFFASEPFDEDRLIDPTQLKSFDVPVDDDFNPFDFDEELYPLP